jgi:hypothetical protein
MQPFTVQSFLSFENLLSARLIRVVYFLGIIGCVVAWVVQLFAALGMMNFSFMSGVGLLLVATLGAILGLLLWRVICESLIVVFGIYDRLGEIRDNTRRV